MTQSERPLRTTSPARRVQVIDRFLKYLHRPERETINVLSAARAWDRALFEQLVTAFQTGYPPTALPELRRFSFIEDVDVEGDDAGPRWTMHALMRRGLQEQWAEENVKAVHQHLFDHYAATLENLDHRTLDETQRSALGEAFYHGRHVLEPEAFIAWFRQADDAFQQGAQWRLLIPLQEELAGVVEAAYGAEHKQTAYALNNLADLYQQQANYDQAEPLYQRSLQIKEQALGPDHPSLATTLNNLANLYESQGKYEQAEPLYQRALTITEQALGPDHPDVAAPLNNLARLYESQGKYEQAEPLYRRALAIMERALGLDHPNTRLVRANLARLRDRRSGEA